MPQPWHRRRSLTTIAGIALAGVLPQLLMYRKATGSWLVDSCGPVGAEFTFGSPHLLGVLFRLRKVYSSGRRCCCWPSPG